MDNQREQLLYDLVDIAEEKSGEEWPMLNDRRPTAPDDLSGLLGGDSES